MSLSFLLFVYRALESLFYWPNSFSELNVFWIGLRFDFLVLSFMLLPIVLMQFLINRRHKWISRLTHFYFMACWLFFVSLYFLNSLLFSILEDRIWLQDWTHISEHLNSAIRSQSLFLLLGLLLFSTGIFIYGFQNLIQLNQMIQNTKKRSVSFLMILFLVFFARGSLGRDHLRRNDCDFKSSSWVRAFCLNPVYTFTKIKNNEF